MRFAAAIAWLAAVLLARAAGSTPLTHQEITAACHDAEGLSHCGQRVESIQMKRLPDVAIRDGDALHVLLQGSGRTTFTDVRATDGGRSYHLWDYLEEIATVVLYVTRGDDASFLLVQRAGGRTVAIPAEPHLAPDRARIVTADFCETRCLNEIGIWRVTGDTLRKEASWTPSERWSDASARWVDAETLRIEFTRLGESTPRSLERRLDQPGWVRIAEP